MRVDNDPKVAMTNTSVWSFVRTSNSFPPIVRAGCGALLRRTCEASLQSAVHDQGRPGLDKQRAYNIYLLDGWRRCRSICEPGQHVKHPADRQPTCQGDFSNTSRSWEKSLTPHM